MASDKKQHGGRRPGAGRKPQGAVKKRRLDGHTIDAEVFARLDAHAAASGESRSAVIERALRAMLEKKEGE